jgi:hypothetical protein
MAIPPQWFHFTFPGDSSASVARWLTLYNWTLNCTVLTRWIEHGRSSHIASERTHRGHCLHHFFYYCVTSLRTRMLRALHNNGCTRHVSWHLLYCCLWALPSNGRCLQSNLLATGLYTKIYFHCFVLREPRTPKTGLVSGGRIILSEVRTSYRANLLWMLGQYADYYTLSVLICYLIARDSIPVNFK